MSYRSEGILSVCRRKEAGSTECRDVNLESVKCSDPHGRRAMSPSARRLNDDVTAASGNPTGSREWILRSVTSHSACRREQTVGAQQRGYCSARKRRRMFGTVTSEQITVSRHRPDVITRPPLRTMYVGGSISLPSIVGQCTCAFSVSPTALVSE